MQVIQADLGADFDSADGYGERESACDNVGHDDGVDCAGNTPGHGLDDASGVMFAYALG